MQSVGSAFRYGTRAMGVSENDRDREAAYLAAEGACCFGMCQGCLVGSAAFVYREIISLDPVRGNLVIDVHSPYHTACPSIFKNPSKAQACICCCAPCLVCARICKCIPDKKGQGDVNADTDFESPHLYNSIHSNLPMKGSGNIGSTMYMPPGASSSRV